MRKLILALAIGLVGAGLVHIAVIFLIPRQVPTSAWQRLADILPRQGATLVDESGALPDANPLFRVAACRYDLSDGPLRVTADGTVPFWSVGLIDDLGRTQWSMNDRNGTGSGVDLMIVDRLQEIELKQNLPADLSSTVIAEVDDDMGMALFRMFQPDPAFAPAVEAFANSIVCETY